MRHQEDVQQRYVIHWFRLQYPDLQGLLYHIPNGQNVGPKVGARLKASGLVSGIPDLHLAVPTEDYPGLYIEMKTEKGRNTPTQRHMQQMLKDVGYCVEVCRSFDEARSVITEYLTGLDLETTFLKV